MTDEQRPKASDLDLDVEVADAARRPDALSVVVAAAFLLMVTVPLAAMLVGVRPSLPDNRAIVQAPATADLVGLDVGAWDQAQQWFRDRLPGLDHAVERDAVIDIALTGRSPDARVLFGEEDWLFLTETVNRACLPDAELQTMRTTLDDVHAAARQAGVRMVTIIAPDKASIRPDRLSEQDQTRSCARRDIERIAAELGGGDVVVPLQHLDAMVAAGHDTYSRKDTHWEAEAAHGVVREVLDRLGMAVGPDAFTTIGEFEAPDDLAGFLGIPATTVRPCWRGVNPGVRAAEVLDACPWRSHLAGRLEAQVDPGASILPRATMLFDSFGLLMYDVLPPFFETLVPLYKKDPAEELFQRELAAADIILMEITQRELGNRLLRADLVTQFRRALADRAPA